MALPSKMSTKQVRFEQSDLAAFLLEKLKRGSSPGWAGGGPKNRWVKSVWFPEWGYMGYRCSRVMGRWLIDVYGYRMEYLL